MSDNPFLLPPGGAPRPAEPAVPASVPPAVAPAAPAPGGYIAVPASVESATHRIARSDPADSGARDADAEISEETRVARPDDGSSSRAAEPSWSLVLPDGSRVTVDDAVLLGRDPASLADRPDARPVTIADSGKTMSKTHALVERMATGLRVRDLHSTNGVAISTAGVRTVLTPGGDGAAGVGSLLELGAVTILVDRR